MNQPDDKLSLVIAELIPPEAANFSGKAHGGYLLHSMDRIAYACATRYAGNYTVTLSVDQVVFREPVYVGELVTYKASINRVGKTSMEVGIKVIAENLETGLKRHTNTCYFTMVALDKQGHPTKAPAYSPETDEQKRRCKEAELRHGMRLDLSKKQAADKLSKGQ